MDLNKRVVARFLEAAAAKQRTYPQAQAEIFAFLKTKGWKVTEGLKVPHATSPDGKFKLWFKAQSVYFTLPNDRGRHEYGDARTINYDHDIRKMSVEEFLEMVLHSKEYREKNPLPR
jgi:hypothetical protein